MYMRTILEKEKYKLRTITCLTLFTHVFCHKHVENFLKGPEAPFINWKYYHLWIGYELESKHIMLAKISNIWGKSNTILVKIFYFYLPLIKCSWKLGYCLFLINGQEISLDIFSLKINFVIPCYGWDSTVSRLQCHYEETVYFLPRSSQEVLVIIWLTSEGSPECHPLVLWLVPLVM